MSLNYTWQRRVQSQPDGEWHLEQTLHCEPPLLEANTWKSKTCNSLFQRDTVSHETFMCIYRGMLRRQIIAARSEQTPVSVYGGPNRHLIPLLSCRTLISTHREAIWTRGAALALIWKIHREARVIFSLCAWARMASPQFDVQLRDLLTFTCFPLYLFMSSRACWPRTGTCGLRDPN